MLIPEKLELRSFMTNYLERAGAVVEEAGYALAEALLPDDLASQYGEQVLLAFDYEVARENPASVFITYGNTLLDTVARMAAGYGRYTVLYGPDPAFHQGRRFDKEIAGKLEFLRCRPPRAVYQWMADHIFWCFYFHATYRSHEKTEELLPVVIDGYTGLPSAGFDSWWGSIVPADRPQYQFSPARGLSPAEVYAAACREAESRSVERVRSLQRQSERQLIREMDRVDSFYRQTLQDIEKKLASAGDEAKKERLVKQRDAVQADWRRREQDILERYAFEVELRLDHLIACHVPRVHIKLELQHKDSLLNATVLYNPLAGALEPPVCPLCRKPAFRLTPDRQGRLVCLKCG